MFQQRSTRLVQGSQGGAISFGLESCFTYIDDFHPLTMQYNLKQYGFVCVDQMQIYIWNPDYDHMLL